MISSPVAIVNPESPPNAVVHLGRAKDIRASTRGDYLRAIAIKTPGWNGSRQSAGLRNRHGTRSNTITIWLESISFYSSSKALQIHTRNLNLNHGGSLSPANCSFANAPVI